MFLALQAPSLNKNHIYKQKTGNKQTAQKTSHCVSYSFDLQDQPFHMLQQFRGEVDVGVAHLKALDLNLGDS